MSAQRWQGFLGLLLLGCVILAGSLVGRPVGGQGGAPALLQSPTATPVPLWPTATPIPWDDILVSEPQYGTAGVSNEALAVAGKNVYIVYHTVDGGARFTRSTDGGHTFFPSVQIHPSGYQLALARREGAGPEEQNLYVAFRYDAIYFARADERGSAWTTPVVVRANPDGWTTVPKIAVGKEGMTYITWAEGSTYSDRGYFFLARSLDGGTTWSAPVQVHQEQSLIASSPSVSSLVTAAGTLYFAWCHFPPSDLIKRIMFVRSTDGGETWSAPVRVDDGGNADKSGMDLAVDAAGVLYAVWSDERLFDGGHLLSYAARSTDGGATWSPGARVDDAGDHVRSSSSGALAWDEATASLHVALQDGRNYWDAPYYLGWCDLFYTCSTDGGLSWSRNEQLSNSILENTTFRPSIQTRNGVVYTTWQGAATGWGGIFLDIHDPRLPPVTITPTPTPSPTPSPTPTATTTPTVTLTPAPTASPSPRPLEWQVGLPWMERR